MKKCFDTHAKRRVIMKRKLRRLGIVFEGMNEIDTPALAALYTWACSNTRKTGGS